MKKKIFISNVIFSLITILLIALDQFTKQLASNNLKSGDIPLISSILRLHYLENKGAAWGILQDSFWLFLIITIIVVAGIIYFYSKIPFTKKYIFLRTILVILLAGAIGNFIDRFLYRYVIDFIYLEFINFPVFNVADCYVTISVVLLIIALLFTYKDDNIIWKKN